MRARRRRRRRRRRRMGRRRRTRRRRRRSMLDYASLVSAAARHAPRRTFKASSIEEAFNVA
eukprot:7609331-Pyramimonas_sp.AAC.1